MCCAPNPPVNFAVFHHHHPNLGAGNLDFVWGYESGSIANWKIGSELAPVALGVKSVWALPRKRERCVAKAIGDQLF